MNVEKYISIREYDNFRKRDSVLIVDKNVEPERPNNA